MERVLVLNAGSSSLKWSVLDAMSEATIGAGEETWHAGDEHDHATTLQSILARAGKVDAAGHRVVHGGPIFRQAVVIDQAVRQAIADLEDLAPLHNASALAGIDAVSHLAPTLRQVACFDTAFHHTIPDAAAVYAVPTEWTGRYGLRRYGFHGLSVSYAVRRTGEVLGRLPDRMVVCHLGSGCSVTAVAGGRSVDTSMGFTPLEGTVMATRSGSIDPGLLLYLLARKGLTAVEVEHALNQQSGLLGLSETSSDLRQIISAMENGDTRAQLAYAAFIHSVVRVVGGMIGVLNGIDALIFSGGIGEHSARARADICANLAFLDLMLDRPANMHRTTDTDLASPTSSTRVLAISAREDLSILREMKALAGLELASS